MVQQKHTLAGLQQGSLSTAISNRTKASADLNLGRRTRASGNSTLDAAKFLGAYPPGKKTVKDSVQNKIADFFQLELTAKSRVRAVLSNRSSEKLTASLLDANGKIISANGKKQKISFDGNQTVETLIRGATPGTYYLKIEGAASTKQRYEVNLFINRNGGPQPLPCDCGI